MLTPVHWFSIPGPLRNSAAHHVTPPAALTPKELLATRHARPPTCPKPVRNQYVRSQLLPNGHPWCQDWSPSPHDNTTGSPVWT